MGIPPDECYVVGDAVWDLLATRCTRMLSVGYGEDELTRADAFRVYRDAEDVTPSTSSASPLSSGVASTGDVSPDWTTMSPFERVERVVLPPEGDSGTR